MKCVLVLPLLGLAACATEPLSAMKCMTPKETGIIKETKEWVEEYTTFRGIPRTDKGTMILVEVAGLVRVCEVDEHAAAMLKPGTKVSLINADRKF